MSGGFLGPAPENEIVAAMYRSDLESQGYVANLTRLWAWCPEALDAVSNILRQATDTAGLSIRDRALLTSAAASTIEDSYCSLAWGEKLAIAGGDDVTAGVLLGEDPDLAPRDRMLVDWARRVAGSPNGITQADVQEMRSADFDDEQVFAVTVYVAMRIAFSTVNDALGASPDAQLVERVPAAVRAAVTWGRPRADSSSE